MKQRKGIFSRLIACILAAMILVGSLQTTVSFAAGDESYAGETTISAEAEVETESEAESEAESSGEAESLSEKEDERQIEIADETGPADETLPVSGEAAESQAETVAETGSAETEAVSETGSGDKADMDEANETTSAEESTETESSFQLFLAVGEALPENLTADNYEETMTMIGECMELYDRLSEEEKADSAVELIYQRMMQLIAASYGTQTLEIGYYTDHNTIMRLPDNYMGVADWGYVRYRTVNGKIAYCVEPNVGIEGAGADYPLSSGSTPNITLDAYQKRALCYVLYYGYYKGDVPEDWQTSFGVANQDNADRNMAINHQDDLAYYAATQVVAWAVIQGYTLNGTNREEVRNTSNGCWAGHMFTAEQISALQSKYTSYFNHIWNNAMAAMNTAIPSFAASAGFPYPTHTLQYNTSTGRYQITLTDTNGVVNSVYTTYSGSGVDVTRSGNSITVSSTSPISESKLITAVPASGTGQAQVPTAALIYWTWMSEDWQMFAAFGNTTTEAINAYFYVNSTQPGKVKVNKTDAKTGERLSGAKYGIYADSGCTSLVGTLTIGTGGDGISSLVPPATLYLKELTAPIGYSLSTVVTKVTVGSGETVSVELTDTPLWTKVALSKIDETDSTVVISGAKFGLYRYSSAKGEYEFITYLTYNSSTKMYESGMLDYTLDSQGKWKIVEEAAQDGYLLKNWSAEFDVTANAEKTVSFTVTNMPIRYRFIKVDDKGNRLAGCGFELYDSDGKLIDSWTTDSTGIHELNGVLKEGETYTLKEVSYPLGYRPAADLSFTVEADQEWVEIRTVNPMIPGSITITKTAADGSLLEGAEIALCSTLPVNGAQTVEYGGQTYYVLQQKTTGADGKITFNQLDTVSGYSYLLVEVHTVSGQTLLVDPILIGTLPVNAGTSVDSSYAGTVQKNGEEYYLYDYEVKAMNSQAYTLPMTGKSGDFFACRGAVMAFAVLSCVMFTKKKDEKKSK